MSKPLAVDLFCGLGGWTDGLLAEGYEVVGFDIERHAYGDHAYPAQLVLQDVRTIHGRQFKDAALIVASPPCQEFSYMAMPWTRAKKIRAEYLSGERDVKKLTALFDACFHIQREAIEATGHFIPLVVENVRGANEWVGRSKANFGSYHLWGDLPALMPMTVKAQKFNPDGTAHPPGSWFAIADSKERGAIKNSGNGSWFYGAAATGGNPARGVTVGEAGCKTAKDGQGAYGGGFGWDDTPLRRGNSKSSARKAASAMIAKIPLPLARWIAAAWKPL